MPERVIQIQKNVYLCFMDYARVYDKVRQKELTELLDKLALFREVTGLTQNL